jgi:hypothetical protein
MTLNTMMTVDTTTTNTVTTDGMKNTTIMRSNYNSSGTPSPPYSHLLDINSTS